jgi:uncharacterized protein with ParB-like and HNH nuclease domain
MTIKIEAAKIENLFLKNLSIPEHQRGYAWKKLHADDFFEDLITSKKSNTEFYLGQFILYEKDRKNSTIKDYSIIDGQQRFTTIWLLFIAIRSAFMQKGLEGTFQAGAINTSLTPTNTKSFEASKSIKKALDYIQDKAWGGDWPETGYVYQVNRIKPVYDYFELELKNKTIEELDEIQSRVNQIDISIITLRSMEEAIAVFERTNARGEPLNIGDLVKNHLYSVESKISKQSQLSLDSQWDKISKNAGNGTNIVKVIRYNYMCREGYIATSGLFREIRKIIKKAPANFLLELVDFSEFYNSIRSLDDDKAIASFLNIFNLKESQEDHRFNIWKSLSGLRAYNVSQCDTLIYAYLKTVSKISNEKGFDSNNSNTKGFNRCIVNFLENLEKFHFHYNLIATGPTNKVETLYANKAKQFMSIKIDNTLIKPEAKLSTKPDFEGVDKSNKPSLRRDWNNLCKIENELMNELKNSLKKENIDEQFYIKAFLQLDWEGDAKDIRTIFSRMCMTDNLGACLSRASANSYVMASGSTWSLDHWFPQTPFKLNEAGKPEKDEGEKPIKDEDLIKKRFDNDPKRLISIPHIHNIGNLIFLPKKPNSKEQNQLPSEKKDSLLKNQDAKFNHVHDFINDYKDHHDEWGSDAIEKRANELAKETFRKWEFKPKEKYLIPEVKK